MSKYLHAFLDLIFYGNFWIALCAASMVIQTNFILHAEYIIDPITYLVFGGTLFIYGIHRAVGISRLKDFLAEKRYAVIYEYRNHIRIYAIIGIMMSGFFFLTLDRTTQLFLIIPALVSAAYVIPFYGRKRLRDFDDIKIFLIAIVFGCLTVLLPTVFLNVDWGLSIFILFLERCCFIFLLTLPFDIRDLKVDKFAEVSTIPARFGEDRTKTLMVIIAGIILACAVANTYRGFYEIGIGLGIIVSTAIALLASLKSKPEKHDYYYTGVIDGMIIIQAVLVLLLGVILY